MSFRLASFLSLNLAIGNIANFSARSPRMIITSALQVFLSAYGSKVGLYLIFESTLMIDKYELRVLG